MATEFMKEPSALKIVPFDFRNYNYFQRRRPNSTWHRTELVCYLGPTNFGFSTY